MHSSFYDDTIIVFTSEHGDTLGAHGGLFQKMSNAYEETLHVPLLLYNRELIPAARSTRFLSSHLDVLPTLPGLAGNPYLPVVQPNHIETVIASLQQNGQTELWKLSLYSDNSQSGTPSAKNSPVADEYELYSLTDDPLEERNLARSPYFAQYTNVFYKMMGLLDEHRRLKRIAPQSSYGG